MFECFHCNTKSVVWDNDFSFEDMGYEGDGIVHCLHCANCRVEVRYICAFDNPEVDDGR